MKKLYVLATFFSIAIFPACVKELKPGDSPGNNNSASTNAKPAPQPPPTSILQWQKCFGSSGNDFGYSIVSNPNAYFLAGYTEGNNGNVSGNHGSQDAWVIKTDLDGTLLWQKAIGGSAGDYADAIVATADGGSVVAGYTNSNNGDIAGTHGGGDVFLVKLTSSGAIEWEKTIGGSGYDRARALISTPDGGFAFAGQTTSSDGDLAGVPGSNLISDGKAWLVKINNAATIEWQTIIAFDGAKDDVAYSMTQAADGGYTIAGRTLSIADVPGICVANVSSSGNLNWRTTTGAGGLAWSVARSSSNDGYVITGYTATNAAVVKLDNNGVIQWQKIFGGSSSGGIQGKAIVSAGQGYMITGSTNSKNGDIIASKGGDDMFVLQLDANGNKISSNVFGGKGSDMGRAILASPDGSYVVAGQTDSNNGDVSGNHGLSDLWLVKVKF